MKLVYAFLITFLLSIQVQAQTCYVTKTGAKYHTSTCSYLKYSKITYKLKDALAAGFTACSRCKPTRAKLQQKRIVGQTITPIKVKRTTTAVQCKGRTQDGNRCKRKTKNASGYCYQHG